MRSSEARGRLITALPNSCPWGTAPSDPTSEKGQAFLMRFIPSAQWFLLPLAHAQLRVQQIRGQPRAFFRGPNLPVVPTQAPASNSFVCATVAAAAPDPMAGKSMVDPRCTNSQAGSGHHLCAAVARVSEPAQAQRRGSSILGVTQSLSRPEKREPAPSSPRRGLATKAECSLLPAQGRHGNAFGNPLANPLAPRPLPPPPILSVSFPQPALDRDAGLGGQGMGVGVLGGAVDGSQLWEDPGAPTDAGAGEGGNSSRSTDVHLLGIEDSETAETKVGKTHSTVVGKEGLPSSLCGKKRKESGRPEPAAPARGAAGAICHLHSGPPRGEAAGIPAGQQANDSTGVTGTAAPTVVLREGKAMPAGDRTSGDAELLSGASAPLSFRPSGNAAPLHSNTTPLTGDATLLYSNTTLPIQSVPGRYRIDHVGGIESEQVVGAQAGTSAAPPTQGACHQDPQGTHSLSAGRSEGGGSHEASWKTEAHKEPQSGDLERGSDGGEAEKGPESGVPGSGEAEAEGANEGRPSAAQLRGGAVGRKEGGSDGDQGVGTVHETTFQLAPCLGSAGGARHKARADLSLVVLNFDLPPFTHILWEQGTAQQGSRYATCCRPHCG